MSKPFSIYVLGCGSALPTKDRFLSSQVVERGRKLFLVDCGEGTQIQLRKFHLAFPRISAIFITHGHGDHFFGLPGLLSTLSLLGRTALLQIYAPKEIEGILNYFLTYHKNELKYAIEYIEVNTSLHQLIYQDNTTEVWSLPLSHRIPTCGYLFKERQKPLKLNKKKIVEYTIPLKERAKIVQGGDYLTPKGVLIPNADLTIAPPIAKSYAYCSDTIYLEKLPSLIKNVTLLYHEATFAQTEKKRAQETFHSTAQEAACIAKKAETSLLMIGHFSARYPKADILLQEAKSIFKNTILANEGLEIDLYSDFHEKIHSLDSDIVCVNHCAGSKP